MSTGLLFILGATQTLLTRTEKTLHGVQRSPSAGRAHLHYVSQAVPNLLGFIRKAHHSHMQGTKWIKSTMDIERIKGYVSSFFFCLLIAPNVLPIMASLHYAGSSHTLMNAAICMLKQLLRVYQSKLPYLEWTRPQQWLGFVNEPLFIKGIITPWLSACCMALLNNLDTYLHLIDNFRIPSQVA